ncbi:MAG: squalene--hopene cyclase, partial [Tepidiformaceae bacterium]
PVVTIPEVAAIPELYLHPEERATIRFRDDGKRLSWRTMFLMIDRTLRATEHFPWKPGRARALAACERWILDHQEADGLWGGIQPPSVYALIALKCQGYENSHPAMCAGIDGLLGSFALETEETFTVQPCLSPVWDTALAVTGLREAGVRADDPALLRAGRWLLAEEIRVEGDWCVKVKNAEPGGWPFEFANDNYPDTDDSAEVLIALRLLDLAGEADGPTQRGDDWLLAMQSKDGGWGAFDRDNTRKFVTQIPFADFGATLDPPTEDVTAHVLEWLMLDGRRRDDRAVQRAVRYLRNTQESDGSWFGRWGVNYVYGTGAAVPALIAAGEHPLSPRIRRAVNWLNSHQNADGGWGETCASYENAALRGRGVSTASQTAWALLALLSGGEIESDTVRRGVAYLLVTQAPDGQWPEDEFTGTGFPRDFMLKYHLYRNYWPLWALGRYRRLLQGTPIHLVGSDPWQ